jgi:hypothetical protein
MGRIRMVILRPRAGLRLSEEFMRGVKRGNRQLVSGLLNWRRATVGL